MNEVSSQIDQWKTAGKIAAEAIKYGREIIKNGVNIKEVCDKIDQKIIELGGKPAWPTQVGCNAVAAHYTPDFDDTEVFTDQLICLDVGAHVDGFVGDTACTIDLSGKHEKLVNAVKEALDAAIKICQVGTNVGDIGKTIQEVITSYGLAPIRNLSGHGISKWSIHDIPTIPNTEIKTNTVLEKDTIIAIEPFATYGTGIVDESEKANIFSLNQRKPVRSPYAREVLKEVEEKYNNLPFTTRWLIPKFGQAKTSLAIKELLQKGILMQHPPLVERGKELVSVWEKTLFIGEDKTIVLTEH